MPRCSNILRTAESLAILAIARAFGRPWLPPQAPQSRADAYGLFSEVLPCAQNTTAREKLVVNPMSRNPASTKYACSISEKPGDTRRRSRFEKLRGLISCSWRSEV